MDILSSLKLPLPDAMLKTVVRIDASEVMARVKEEPNATRK